MSAINEPECKCLDCVLERITEEVCANPPKSIGCDCGICRNRTEEIIEKQGGNRCAPSSFWRCRRLLDYLKEIEGDDVIAITSCCTKNPDRIPYKESPVCEEPEVKVKVVSGELLGFLAMASVLGGRSSLLGEALNQILEKVKEDPEKETGPEEEEGTDSVVKEE